MSDVEQRKEKLLFKVSLALIIWIFAAGIAFLGDILHLRVITLKSGISLPKLIGYVASIFALAETFSLFTIFILIYKSKPVVEGEMLRRIYILLGFVSAIATIIGGLGFLSEFGALFAMFGGMILGWSLQAPVSGLAAWLLVSLKRPFRPHDRIQFPGLDITGDVEDIGLMYTMLNQVGGSVGSEEAVGRFILVPNAMLFNYVVINYTMEQKAPYMLDEVVVKITYDSDWSAAENILINAATEVTGDIIEATEQKPYIRSELYDYGVHMCLRYQTMVKDRAEIAHKINKKIFMGILLNHSVDIAIPFIYSFRAGKDMKDIDTERGIPTQIQDISMDLIECEKSNPDPDYILSLSRTIAIHGLLQPIVVVRNPKSNTYKLIIGNMRYLACKILEWKTIPAIVKEPMEYDSKTGGFKSLDA